MLESAYFETAASATSVASPPTTLVDFANRGTRPPAPERLYFRSFTVYPTARLLLNQGRPVEVGSRAFDLLVMLLRRRGELIDKAELLACVWPTTLVTDENIRFQMHALRRVLGADGEAIKTIPGRGYLLATEWTETAAG